MNKNYFRKFTADVDVPVTIIDILGKLQKQGATLEELQRVEKAYVRASEIHKTHTRQSGEKYIIHPLHVAWYDMIMGAHDIDEICAALLHDTVEDSKGQYTIANVQMDFNPTVAMLVDGVTKIKNISEAETKEKANTKKILESLTIDYRCIRIKVADRIHNMKTLNFKPDPEKRVKIAKETMQLIVPLAKAIGSHQAKNILEELSLQYINPPAYSNINELKQKRFEEQEFSILEFQRTVMSILNKAEVAHYLELRDLTTNSIYRRLQAGYQFDKIPDVFYTKVIVPDRRSAYIAQGEIHEAYKVVQGTINDYISNPDSIFYQSLNSLVYNPDEKMPFAKIKIRTAEMDNRAKYGPDSSCGSIDEIQKMILNDPFCVVLRKLLEEHDDLEGFYKALNEELLTPNLIKVSVGDVDVLVPKGSTIGQVASKYIPDFGIMEYAMINGQKVPLDTVISNPYSQISASNDSTGEKILQKLPNK